MGRRGFFWLVAVWLLAAPANATTDIHVKKKAVIKTTPEHILEVLSSSQICDKGCKYYGPSIAREVKLKQRAKSNSFYKWTHVSGIKTVKFFKHLTVTRGKVWKIHVRTLTEERDRALIKELESKTGMEHDPVFELSTATYTVTPKNGQVEVEVRTMTRIGGLLSMFSGTVKTETEKSLAAMFKNFAR